MTRRQWMWLWIWLLLFFIIFCVWNKLLALKEQNMAAGTKPVIMTGANGTTPPKAEIKSTKDILLKIAKDGDIVKLSGVFPSQQALEKAIEALKSAGSAVQKGTIIIDKEADNKMLREALPAFARDLKKFSTGILEYRDHKLTIDGIVKDASVIEDINRIFATLPRTYQTQNLVSVAKKEQPGKAEEPKGPALQKEHNETATAAAPAAIPAHEAKSAVTKPKASAVQTPHAKSRAAVQKDAQQRLDKILRGKRIEFLYAKDTLTPDSKKVLDQIAKLLQKFPGIRIEIAGHTDADGPAKRNLILSRRRAQSVKNYLVKSGITPSRLVAKGYGESKPLVKNDTPAHKQRNRRVEFHIIKEERK